ncbi:hypothetical protein FACS189456_4990 [Bacteroidia bacterium]|nr:hypothetical protein FACS189456_4990 [Bacteroidia bacterium]
MATTLDREATNRIGFITYLIVEFAEAFKMSKPNAYHYLQQYGGLDFLYKHWWALHTDNKYYALLDLYEVCRKNGGYR